MTLTSGARLGVYSVVSKLGAGGMGEVYRARDTKLDRDVAIKILPDTFASDAERVARFAREAKTLAALNHPHIAHIYSVEDGDGRTEVRPYIVMELVDGEDLAERLKRGPIPLDEALPIARQIAEGLEAAHEQGIIHRDLKPANIKVRADGTVKILDFGLAKALDQDPKTPGPQDLSRSPTITTPAMTMRGVILGTAAYMAPEQAKGRIVDKRADIWAFGCLLFEMLTGQRPFDGEDMSDTLASVLRAEPDWPALEQRVPPAIVRTIRRCLVKDPRQRTRDVGDLRIQLDEATNGSGPAAPVPATMRSSNRLPWMVAFAAIAIAIVAVVAAFGRRNPVEPLSATAIRFSMAPPEGARLLFNPGSGRLAFAMSPDGLKVAAVMRMKNRSSRVLVRRLDEPSFRELPGTEGAGNVFWAPDSERLGVTTAAGVVYTSLSGVSSPPMAGVPRGARVSWGRDDRFAASSAPGRPLSRWTLGSSTPVEDPPLPQGIAARFDPSWLPDDAGLLFIQQRGDTRAVVQETRNEVKEMMPVDVATLASATAIYASGHLVVARTDRSGRSVMTAQPFDPATATLSGSPLVIASNVNPMISASSNGVLAFSSAVRRGQELSWIDADGAIRPASGTFPMLQNMALSPDGGHLVIQESNAIRVVDLERRAVTTLASQGVDPIWSPDGRQIAYALNSGSESAIHTVSSSGGASRKLVAFDEPIYIDDWSPDGKWIAGHIQVQGAGVLVPVEPGAKPVSLGRGISGAAAMDETVFSPDGRWLAYGLNEGDSGEVHIIPVPPTGESWKVSVDGGAQPRWRGDGKALFYLSLTGMMMTVDLDLKTGAPPRISPPRPLFDTGLEVTLGTDQYAVSEDGKRFLVARPSDTGARDEIEIIVNWPALLKK